MAASMEEIIDENIGRKVSFQRVDVDNNNSLKAIWFHFFKNYHSTPSNACWLTFFPQCDNKEWIKDITKIEELSLYQVLILA